MVLNEGDFASPGTGGIFSSHKWDTGAIGIQWTEAKDAAQDFRILETPPLHDAWSQQGLSEYLT